jgi:hypothetical protein
MTALVEGPRRGREALAEEPMLPLPALSSHCWRHLLLQGVQRRPVLGRRLLWRLVAGRLLLLLLLPLRAEALLVLEAAAAAAWVRARRSCPRCSCWAAWRGTGQGL